MEAVWKGDLCEILDLGDNNMRIYCEGISQMREDHVLDTLSVSIECDIKSRTNGQFDGALIVDFKNEDYQVVLTYFGKQDGR